MKLIDRLHVDAEDLALHHLAQRLGELVFVRRRLEPVHSTWSAGVEGDSGDVQLVFGVVLALERRQVVLAELVEAAACGSPT